MKLQLDSVHGIPLHTNNTVAIVEQKESFLKDQILQSQVQNELLLKQQELSIKSQEEKTQEIYRLEQRLKALLSEQDFLKEEIQMTEQKWKEKLEQSKQQCT